MCEVCGESSSWSWTDTHGVAQCYTCGTPYVILHYENSKRVNKPATIAVKEHYIPALKEYWQQTKSRIPGGHSFSDEQELATADERRRFRAWLDDWTQRNQEVLASS